MSRNSVPASDRNAKLKVAAAVRRVTSKLKVVPQCECVLAESRIVVRERAVVSS